MVVEGWLARAAVTRPERTALQTPLGSWSYTQLHAAARFGAGQLAARGAGPGARVAIALPAGLAFAQALHACLLLGAVAVPVDLRLTDVERARIADGCALLVEEPLGDGPVPAAIPAACEHDLDATAVVIYTSGTAASPRPVQLTYGNFLWSALGSAVALGRDPDERWLCALPLSHVGGLSILLRSAIYATSAVVHERFEVDRVLHVLREQEVTLVSLVATTLARLLDGGLTDPPALRCALTGGGPVPAALLRRAHAAGVPVSLTYGLTETCSQVTTTPVAEIEGSYATARPSRASAGPPLFCTRVCIAGAPRPGRDRAAATGPAPPARRPAEPEVGEILVRGPTVAPGALASDGWLHTGDLGSLDERARLLVTGRKADTIVSGGENVTPAEVEAVLEAHPSVIEAAVLGRCDPRWGEAVTAIVRARPGVVLEIEELRAHCARALAPYKVPKKFVLSAEPLPRTRSGKLLRRELR
jgi:O-succinylbenzoic acid--CoA ligase